MWVRRATDVELEVRLALWTLSVPVRAVRRSGGRQHGHVADRTRYLRDRQRSLASSAAIPVGGPKRSVRPSAQPAVVRTHHLPPQHETAPDLYVCQVRGCRVLCGWMQQAAPVCGWLYPIRALAVWRGHGIRLSVLLASAAGGDQPLAASAPAQQLSRSVIKAAPVPPLARRQRAPSARRPRMQGRRSRWPMGDQRL